MAPGAQLAPRRRHGSARPAIALASLAVYAALLALHAPLLRLPYYWDEAGYYIFAARDCFLHLWLIPRSTLANGHPPLLSLYLSAVWLATGFHIWATRAAMLVWAAALLCAVYALARTRLGRRTAAVPALLLGLSPLVFAQATLAQLDLPVAALILWALVARHARRGWTEAFLLAAACLMKETAVIVPAVLLAYDWLSHRRPQAARLLLPIAVLAAWYIFYHAHTGYWFGNPQYFAYNVGAATASLPRIVLTLLRRLWQLTLYDGTGFLTLLAVLAFFWRRWRQLGGAPSASGRTLPGIEARTPSDQRERPEQKVASHHDSSRAPRWPVAWLLVIAVYVLFHAAVGGAVLARYLLPALALYYIALSEWLLRLPRPRCWIAAAAAVLIASWFWNPPYPFPYEDNLAYVHFIRLHQAAARELESHPPSGPIWTVWPATDELTRPALGYVTHPLRVHELPNFSPATLASISTPPPVLYLYSRSYQPHFDLARSTPFWSSWAHRFFAYTPPPPPHLWLTRLHLTAFFRLSSSGQWILLASP